MLHAPSPESACPPIASCSAAGTERACVNAHPIAEDRGNGVEQRELSGTWPVTGTESSVHVITQGLGHSAVNQDFNAVSPSIASMTTRSTIAMAGWLASTHAPKAAACTRLRVAPGILAASQCAVTTSVRPIGQHTCTDGIAARDRLWHWAPLPHNHERSESLCDCMAYSRADGSAAHDDRLPPSIAAASPEEAPTPSEPAWPDWSAPGD